LRGSDSIGFCNNYPLFILSIEEQIEKEVKKNLKLRTLETKKQNPERYCVRDWSW